MIKSIIIDDELPAINILKHHLKPYSEIDICGEFMDTDDALIYVKSNGVDIVFLDIHMPEKTGIDILRELGEINKNIDVIFVTAYSKYAVDAFELNALDYLVKPVSAARIEKTVRKIIDKRTKNISHTRLDSTSKFLKIYCLGETKILDKDNNYVKFRSPKAEELFLYLVNNCGNRTPKENIIDTLWLGFSKDKALSNLNSTIYSIRKVISEITNEEIIVYSQGKFSIHTQNVYIDFLDFENKAKLIINGTDITLNEIEAVLDIHRGCYLDGNGYVWAEGKQIYFEELYIKLYRAASEVCMKKEKYKQAIEYLQKISKADPYNEETYEHIIKCYIQLGDRLSALKCYEELKILLEEELGVKPNKKMIKLLER